MTKKINGFCLFLILASIALWLIGPFAAVNLLTTGEQPTAIEIISEDVFLLGDIKETAAYWAALGSGLGLVLCLVCTLMKKDKLTRVFAAVSLAPMLFAVVEALRFVKTGYVSIMEMLGLGFMAVFCLLVVLVFASKSKVEATAQNTYYQPVTNVNESKSYSYSSTNNNNGYSTPVYGSMQNSTYDNGVVKFTGSNYRSGPYSKPAANNIYN